MWWSTGQVWHFHHSRFLVLVVHFALRNVRFQSLVEVGGTHDGVGDGDDEENNGDDSECRKRFPRRNVACCSCSVLVHPHKLEKEVGEAAKVERLHCSIVS